MRRSRWSHSLVAGIVILAMVGCITGLFGAPGATITITSPKAGARVSGTVEIQVSVRTAADVTYVICGIDGDRPYSTNSAPYVFSLDTRTLTDGPHRIFAEAYDHYGMLGASKAITINVRNGSASIAPPQQAAARVAASPSAEPPVRAASRTAEPGARTVTKAEGTDETAAVSPSLSARGPLPEPARSGGRQDLTATQALAPARQAVASVPSGHFVDTPSARERAAERTRGHTVVLNGHAVEFDVAPTIADGRMQVGFRAMFESVGANVSWLPATRTARSVQPSLEVEVVIGDGQARVNGNQVDVGVTPRIVEGRTIVPLRFFAAATGAALHWDRETRVASVNARTVAVAERPAKE